MALSDLTVSAIEAAMDEFDVLGRDAFLTKYGFGQAKSYFILRNDVAYDSKAICGAAHGKIGGRDGPLTPSEFSGGDKTVVARLETLGFVIITESLRMRVTGLDGAVLNATCELHRKGDAFVITLHSRGGAKNTPQARNPDYNAALTAILTRLARLRATLDAVLLDSSRTRHLAETDRLLAGSTQPIATADVAPLVASITRAAARFSDKRAKGGGNPTKQIQLRFTAPMLVSAADVRSRVVLDGARVFVLTWNPKVWEISTDTLDGLIARTDDGEPVPDTWSTGNRKSGIGPGDQVVLLRQESERGIIARGVATSGVYEGEHFNDATKVSHYVRVVWTEWLATDDRLPVEQLQLITSQTNWNSILGSGMQLPSNDAQVVLAAWDAHSGSTQTARTGDECVDGLPEGGRRTVTVNRYERSRAARAKCLKAHGTACMVCAIDFSDAYGGVADGFIHVHHIVPISTIGKTYRLDPIKDLVPVCPNCHAMLHHGVKEPRAVDELRRLLKPQGAP